MTPVINQPGCLLCVLFVCCAPTQAGSITAHPGYCRQRPPRPRGLRQPRRRRRAPQERPPAHSPAAAPMRCRDTCWREGMGGSTGSFPSKGGSGNRRAHQLGGFRNLGVQSCLRGRTHVRHPNVEPPCRHRHLARRHSPPHPGPHISARGIATSSSIRRPCRSSSRMWSSLQ
jgi:hypothetical protein